MAGLVTLLLGLVVAVLMAGLSTNFASERLAKNLVSCGLIFFTFVLRLIRRDESEGDEGRFDVVVEPDM